MFKNYLKTAIRNIVKHKLYSAINILGLAVGLTCCILIYLNVADEFSYDNFHKNHRLLFRVIRVSYNNSDGSIYDRSWELVPPMGPVLTEYFPGIKYQTRFTSWIGVVRCGDKIFSEQINMSDLPFFKMFTFPLIVGSPEAALAQDNAIVLTQRTAKKYFGEKNPLGKTLTITYGKNIKDYMVTGIAKDVVRNSSIQFDLLINISNLPYASGDPQALDHWENQMFPIFVQLNESVSVENIEQQFHAFTTQFFSSTIQRYREQRRWTRKENPFSFVLQNIKDVRLDSGRGLTPVLFIIGIALITLIIASINFTNLSIGISSLRSLEIGIRKVVGAEKKQLVEQFLSESLVMAFISMAWGMLFAEFLLPPFNLMINKQLSIGDPDIYKIGGLIAIAVLTGILAGCYPALVMAGFKPKDIMSGKLKIGRKTFFTKALVVIQFTLSIILVISAILIGAQLKLLVHKDIGYKKEGLVGILLQETPLDIEENTAQRMVNLFRNKVIQHKNVSGITVSSNAFGVSASPQWNLKKDGEKIQYHWNRVDNNFFRTLGMEILMGRDFSQNITADSDAAIVNQKFIQALDMNSPIGRTIGDPTQGFPYNLKIIGVVKDFHYGPLNYEIKPAIFHMQPIRSYNIMLVRIPGNNIKETLSVLENTWKELRPDKPFIHYFQEDVLENLYIRERRWSTLVKYSSILAVLVACMGIFGLTALTIGHRVKEIGIRKVFGATIAQNVSLIIKEFVILVAIANVIAWPVVYFLIMKVLRNYPYRVGIGIHYFLITGMASLVLAVFIIMYLAIKSALSNPIDMIRNE